MGLSKKKDNNNKKANAKPRHHSLPGNIPGTDEALAAMQSIDTREIFDNLRGGRSVSLEFFKRHGWLLSTFIIVLLSLMGLRYRTQTRMVEIQSLTNELEKAESEKLTEKKEYMTLIRQTRMNELVKEHGLPLIHQEQPPFVIDDDKPVTDNDNK